MSIVVASGIAILALLVLGNHRGWFVKTVLGVVVLCFVCVSFLALNKQVDMFLKIPGTRIEYSKSIEVPTTASFVLESNQSSFLPNEFVLTNDNADEMSEWLQDTKKSIWVRLVSGKDSKYTTNLGLYKDGMAEEVLDIYNSWQQEGVVPVGTVTYWFFCFYLEV